MVRTYSQDCLGMKIQFGSYESQGCIETPECDWYYVNKVYYKGRLLSLEPLSHDLKNVRTLFQVIE